MHLISVCVLLCVVRSIVCCPAPEKARSYYYIPGAHMELYITQSNFPDDTKTYQIYEGDCVTSSLTLQLESAVALIIGKHRRFETQTSYYYKINDNICSYVMKIQGTGWERQVILFNILENDRGQAKKADENSSPRFRLDLEVYWNDEPCVNILQEYQYVKEFSKSTLFQMEPLYEGDAPTLEISLIGEIGEEVQPSCSDLTARATLVNDQMVNVALLPVLYGKNSTYRMRLHNFDNYTYLVCRPDNFGNSLKETRLEVKAISSSNNSFPSYNKVHEYVEQEPFVFECADYNYETPLKILFFLEYNKNNKIVSTASSIESTTFVKYLKLTKRNHNSKLLCMNYECRDSDEGRECTRRILNAVTLQMSETHIVDRVPNDKCQLPAYPLNGRYEVFNTPSATPFQVSDFWILDVVCNLGFGILDGETRYHCDTGVWSPSSELPYCIPFCKLTPHPSVTYNCQARDNSSLYTRACSEYEPPGMLAVAECKKPEYVSNDELPIMYCSPKGEWSNSPICMRACGEMTPHGVVKIKDKEFSNLGKLPWHVGIYQKTSTPYEQICGGSIVRPSVVISAAHCFWNDKMPDDQKLRPADEFAVAAGKVYRPWDYPTDNQYDQKADVITINVPNRFLGSLNNFMDDLAVLLLSKSFEFHPHIAPVCLNFNDHYDRVQVAKGVIGKVPSWGLTSVHDDSSTLQVVEVSLVPYLECYNTSPLGFRRYITGDKICARYRKKGMAICKGDSGTGLVVAGNDHAVTRYYLRAVVSAAPDERKDSCADNKITAFTHVIKHYIFVKTYLLL